jgi:hypothetical protein
MRSNVTLLQDKVVTLRADVLQLNAHMSDLYARMLTKVDVSSFNASVSRIGALELRQSGVLDRLWLAESTLNRTASAVSVVELMGQTQANVSGLNTRLSSVEGVVPTLASAAQLGALSFVVGFLSDNHTALSTFVTSLSSVVATKANTSALAEVSSDVVDLWGNHSTLVSAVDAMMVVVGTKATSASLNSALGRVAALESFRSSAEQLDAQQYQFSRSLQYNHSQVCSPDFGSSFPVAHSCPMFTLAGSQCISFGINCGHKIIHWSTHRS